MYIEFGANLKLITFKVHNKVYPTPNYHSYSELLKLKDPDALLMQIGHSSFSLYGLNSDFIVYPSNGKVKLFKLSEIVPPNNKTKIKRIKIKKKEYQRYWDFLNTVVREGKFKINKIKPETKRKWKWKKE